MFTGIDGTTRWPGTKKNNFKCYFVILGFAKFMINFTF